jgi:DNA-binding transcriptional ArsR family regulator
VGGLKTSIYQVGFFRRDLGWVVSGGFFLAFLLDRFLLVSACLRLVDAYLQAGLDALGDGTRMAIFQRLANGPMAVNELASMLPVSRPAVSQHLRVLKDAGLVVDSAEGTRRMYRLDPEGVARLRAHFDQVWERALGSFEMAVETGRKGESDAKDSRGNGGAKKRPGGRAH